MLPPVPKRALGGARENEKEEDPAAASCLRSLELRDIQEAEAFEALELRLKQTARDEIDRIDNFQNAILKSIPTRVKQMKLREFLKLSGQDVVVAPAITAQGRRPASPVKASNKRSDGGDHSEAPEDEAGPALLRKRPAGGTRDMGTQTPVVFTVKKRRSGEKENMKPHCENSKAGAGTACSSSSMLGLTPLTPLQPAEAANALAKPGADATPLAAPTIEEFRRMGEGDQKVLLGKLGSALQLLLEAHRNEA